MTLIFLEFTEKSNFFFFFFFFLVGVGGFTEKQYIGEGIAYKGLGGRPGQFADLREA